MKRFGPILAPKHLQKWIQIGLKIDASWGVHLPTYQNGRSRHKQNGVPMHSETEEKRFSNVRRSNKPNGSQSGKKSDKQNRCSKRQDKWQANRGLETARKAILHVRWITKPSWHAGINSVLSSFFFIYVYIYIYIYIYMDTHLYIPVAILDQDIGLSSFLHVPRTTKQSWHAGINSALSPLILHTHIYIYTYIYIYIYIYTYTYIYILFVGIYTEVYLWSCFPLTC